MLDCVIEEGPGVWQLASTITDLRRELEHEQDPAIRTRLSAVEGEREKLLPDPTPAP